jgi:uncharacterized protein (DUF1697 family)
MTSYVALLRAVNVGGTGKLAMKDLARICTDCGFSHVRTYIQTGNVVFTARGSADAAALALETALAKRLGAKVDVIVRTGSEMARALAGNPFASEPASKVVVFFAKTRLRAEDFAGATGVAGEEVRVEDRNLYVFFPEGQGRSKLKLPKALGVATARNMNTVAKLVGMCADLGAKG